MGSRIAWVCVLLSGCAPPSPCRGALLELAQACSAGEGRVPEASELEVHAPEVIRVTSGGRAGFVVELRNVSGHPLSLSLAPSEVSATIAFGGRRIDASCAPSSDGDAAIAYLELARGGVLRIPLQITAWASVAEGACPHGDEVARAPLPPGTYEAALTLPWSWTRTVRLEVEPRDARFTASEWPRGEPALTCAVDRDCVIVSGPCAAQSVSLSSAEATLRVHEVLAARGACETGSPLVVPRCVDALCVEER